MFAFFLSSGLFLGWSLGANNTSNVFGTAVGSRMINFRTAAIYCSVFVILGSVISGAGVTDTLIKLGSINAMAGAFIVALASAVSILLMTRAGIPVSTSQAIIGGIVGWNFFTGSLTDYDILTKILMTWVICPILSAIFAIILYKLVGYTIKYFKIGMFKLDLLIRYGLIIVGALGAYSMGANNISTVMGIFVPVSPFTDLSVAGIFSLTAAQQLFFIGGIAIAIGVFTYSRRVIVTVGEGIIQLSPVAAFVAVGAHSIVLFLFASQGIEGFLISHGLPTIPLVPVSSSQAIVGAVIGIGLLTGGRNIRWRLVGGIASGWVATPIIAAIISFISLFFLQNVFQQETYRPISYRVTQENVERINRAGIDTKNIMDLVGKEFSKAVLFKDALSGKKALTREEQNIIMKYTKVNELEVTKEGIAKVDATWITGDQKRAIQVIKGKIFAHTWLFEEALANITPQWRPRENDREYNKELTHKFSYIYEIFRRDTASMH